MIDERKTEPRQPTVAEQMACPMCGATIAFGALRCGSCFENVAVSMPPAKRGFFFSPIEWLVVIATTAVTVALLLPTVQQAGSGGRRDRCRDNLKQIGLALSLYHDEYGTFPPAFVPDENGRPMHSWRVLILPFLGHRQLYEQYRFDERWDGPNNSRISDKIIDQFNCPGAKHMSLPATPMTSYVAVLGHETAWPGETPMKLADITDRTADTLLVVETTNSGIRWAEPRDLHVSELAPRTNSKSTAGISSVHIGGAQALFADGHVEFLSEKLPATTIQAALTRGGGEFVGER